MKKVLGALAMLTLASAPLTAEAASVNLNTWYTFGFGGPGSNLISGAGFIAGTNPSSAIAPDGPWEFTLLGKGKLVVLDLFLSIDTFEIFDSGNSLGVTSAETSGGQCGSNITCALGDLRYSRGIFDLGPGSYSITGTHLAGAAGAAVFQVTPSAVPLPAAGGLLLGALGLLGAYRRKKTATA